MPSWNDGSSQRSMGSGKGTKKKEDPWGKAASHASESYRKWDAEESEPKHKKSRSDTSSTCGDKPYAEVWEKGEAVPVYVSGSGQDTWPEHWKSLHWQERKRLKEECESMARQTT